MKLFPRWLFIALLMVGGVRVAQAQVRIPTMGDTTRRSQEDTVRYGPETTFYFNESDLRFNRGVRQQTIDTTLTGAYNFHPVEAAGNNIQYLGTLGMAARPLFPEPARVTGVLPGQDAFDLYVTEPREVKYYNSRSPYILMHPTFGGQGRSAGEVIFTQNVRPNWNVGVEYKWLSIETQVGPSTRNDRVVESSHLSAFTYFQTKNKRYDLLANFTRFGHNVEEYGGVNEVVDPRSGYRDFFRYDNTNVWLEEFTGREFRFNYHLYHQYQINELLQVYHEFDRRIQNDFFQNQLGTPEVTVDSLYFRRILIDTTETSDALRFNEWNNEVGIKGKLSRLFYSLHYRARQAQVRYNRDTVVTLPTFGPNEVSDRRRTELYAGFNLRLDLGERTFLRGGADYLSAESYRLEAEFSNPILKGKFVRARTLPSFTESQFVGNHNYWRNDFAPVGTDQLTGSIEYSFPNLYVRPFATLTNVNRPIYYVRDTVPPITDPNLNRSLVSRQAYPVQASGGVRILSPGVQFNADFLKRMHVQNRLTYTLVTGPADEAFPLPQWLAHTRLYYENTFRQGKITLQLGLDAQFTSAYLAPDYDVATRQFFVQPDGVPDNGPTGELSVPLPDFPGYVVVDAFFMMKVRTAIIYVKIPYVNQDIPENGYFAAPFYPGQQRALADVGIRWMFFD
ncbi:MAG: putative porin [Tunicatimonas sp.]